MDISNESVLVQFKIIKENCPCCGRDFEDAEEGEQKQFLVTLEDIFSYMNWSDGDEIYEEDLVDSIDDFLYNTIRFYAIRSEETLQIEKSEIEKVIFITKKEVERQPNLDFISA